MDCHRNTLALSGKNGLIREATGVEKYSADGGAMAEPPVTSETLTCGLLPDLTDRHVHAVYRPGDDYPDSVCGWPILACIYLSGPVLLCRRCLAALPDNAELRPATSERRLANPSHAGPLVEFERWRRARKYDRRIQRAVAEGWHRG